MRWLFRSFINATKPQIQRLAQAYDLRIERPLHAFGQHSLDIADIETARDRIPKSTYFNTRSGRISIGPDTVFGEDVKLLTGKHMHAAEAARAGVALHSVPEEGRAITIGAGCYVGTGAILIGPVTVGDGAVVGAGSVVTHDVPAHGFVAGVPARLVRMLREC